MPYGIDDNHNKEFVVKNYIKVMSEVKIVLHNLSDLFYNLPNYIKLYQFVITFV